MVVKYSEGDDIENVGIKTLVPGDNFHVYRGLRHQMIALEDSECLNFLHSILMKTVIESSRETK